MAGHGGQQFVALLGQAQIGRAHVWTPVTNAPLVCRLLLEQKKETKPTKSTHRLFCVNSSKSAIAPHLDNTDQNHNDISINLSIDTHVPSANTVHTEPPTTAMNHLRHTTKQLMYTYI